jgi:hypothetical protein
MIFALPSVDNLRRSIRTSTRPFGEFEQPPPVEFAVQFGVVFGCGEGGFDVSFNKLLPCDSFGLMNCGIELPFVEMSEFTHDSFIV